MSRTACRAAVAGYLSGNVTGVAKFYASIPSIIQGRNFFDPAARGLPGGCIGWLTIVDSQEARKASGGPTSGWKRVDYTMDIELLQQWNRRAQATADGSGDAAIDAAAAFDTIIDNLVARIRTDRTAGTGGATAGTVWQWGEGELIGRFAEAMTNGSTWFSWAAVRTQVTEFIQS